MTPVKFRKIQQEEIKNDKDYLIKKIKILNEIKKKIEESKENTTKK